MDIWLMETKARSEDGHNFWNLLKLRCAAFRDLCALVAVGPIAKVFSQATHSAGDWKTVRRFTHMVKCLNQAVSCWYWCLHWAESQQRIAHDGPKNFMMSALARRGFAWDLLPTTTLTLTVSAIREDETHNLLPTVFYLLLTTSHLLPITITY